MRFFALFGSRTRPVQPMRACGPLRVAEKLGMTLEKDISKWGKRLCVYAITQAERTG